jgi:tetratricopeptide (TPR) repeat protein
LSLIYAEKEEYIKALEIVDKALEINKNEIYQNNKAYYLLNLGKLEEGKNLLDIILEKNQKSAWAFRNLGIYYYKNKNFAKANENFLKSDKIDPSVELLNYYLGLIQQSLGYKSKACEYWSIGKKLNEAKSIEMLTEICK